MIPAWARTLSSGITTPLSTVSGTDIELTIARQSMMIDGKPFRAIGVNGTVPAPLIRLKEGQHVRLKVNNRLDEDSSIHWHGLLVPPEHDGVPGVSFPGIKPGGSYLYEFDVKQNGTYWYHSHSGLQEQEGHYGPIIIDPAGTDPVQYDREHVIVLSDHSPLSPAAIFRRLKVNPGHFNFQRQTLSGLLAGRDQPLKERLDWGQMRMDPADISDVNGSTYTFLVNGHGPEDNWTALFQPGERVRLRVINASAMTTFNVRIPGLTLQIVQADGQNVMPIDVEEFQIGVAETYDLIVRPKDAAYTLVGEAVDRSGMARATLAPRPGMEAEVPALRKRPLATMKDMGMDMPGMEGMDMTGRGIDPTAEQNASARLGAAAPATASTMAMGAAKSDNMASMDHSGMAGMDHGAMSGTQGAAGAPMDHSGHDMGSMKMLDPSVAPQVKMGPGVAMLSVMPVDRTGERPTGLEEVTHRVLTYRQLRSLDRNPDPRGPSRELDLHLTANMERYMWGFDGRRFSEIVEPIRFERDERVRVTLVNDTMMQHPIHLHGHFFELVNGHGANQPLKHTVNVAPGGRLSFDLTADAPGDWAVHCHMMMHMHSGMFNVVSIRPLDGIAS